MAGLPAARIALAAETDATNPNVTVETITFQGHKGPLKAYLARPKGATTKRPGVVIIHEIRGINNHFRDLARRLASAGMIALVPDLASAQPSLTQEGSDEVRDYLQKQTVADLTLDYQAALATVKAMPECSGALGVVGFYWGGIVAEQLAMLPTNAPKAAVLYYAAPVNPDNIQKLNAAVLFHYAEQDPRTQPQIEIIERKLIGYSKIYEQYIYDGGKPNFANESLPKWYNKDQAALAWGRTIAFLRRQLGA
jgi:carboxymethylenebutenolidase